VKVITEEGVQNAWTESERPGKRSHSTAGLFTPAQDTVLYTSVKG
jgi:hypothetical protein